MRTWLFIICIMCPQDQRMVDRLNALAIDFLFSVCSPVLYFWAQTNKPLSPAQPWGAHSLLSTFIQLRLDVFRTQRSKIGLSSQFVVDLRLPDCYWSEFNPIFWMSFGSESHSARGYFVFCRSFSPRWSFISLCKRRLAFLCGELILSLPWYLRIVQKHKLLC